MIPPDFNVRPYLEDFQSTNVPSVITNHHGSILEANEGAARIFNVESPTFMRTRPLVSYVHRKYTDEFRKIVMHMDVVDSYHDDEIWFRARKGLPFRADVVSNVVVRSRSIALIRWDIQDVAMMLGRDEMESGFASGTFPINKRVKCAI